ncbi:RNA polymerase sigma factor SigY [Paenibacillus alvei]|uniref:RNA polymerase sigma factor SigY n=1 Tax=Paenibacillus alvei TaxID=44250 RepID=UPI0018CF92B7|nr:RNA polymerase sigma factor SigY [Paenibacillus alvei]MBG9737454.1 RNA polymerase sigma factor SigY [Paenibacillus alvei]MBG9746004.1 RNA polymerase sigma factor SigY [Paenibacillus alvei]MCY9578985.1 RNA polymerase sigma factor SigY [Paenibacillus alvei]MCY9583413.1 RNA polymerase sigma factor SigY [Paenibacillus alvei]
MSEQHRIEQAVRGDMNELAVLLHENYSFLFKYALKLTMNSACAEDLVQDTMVRCMEKIHTYNGESRFSSWLITIATRLYYDMMRRKKVESRWREQEQGLRQLRYQMESCNIEWTTAMELLGELTYEQRAPIVLKHYYGYQVNEIANMLNVQAGTVKSRLHYGLEKLRKEWEQDE